MKRNGMILQEHVHVPILSLLGGVELLFIYGKYSTSMILSSQKFFEMMPLALTSQGIESPDSPILQMASQVAEVLNWPLSLLSPCQPQPRSPGWMCGPWC